MPEQNVLLTGLSQQDQDRIGKMADKIQKKLLARVVESLDKNRLEELLKILESSDADELQIFLQDNVPAFFDWLEQEIENIKQV